MPYSFTARLVYQPISILSHLVFLYSYLYDGVNRNDRATSRRRLLSAQVQHHSPLRITTGTSPLRVEMCSTRLADPVGKRRLGTSIR
jgi:hypothetical protein